jgi:hypothetical protein
MIALINNKYLINKLFGLIKFCFSLGLLAFLVIKAPDQSSQVVNLVAAFLLGGSKLSMKLGLI